MDYLAIFQLAMKYGPIVKGILDIAISNADVVAKLKEMAAPVAEALEGIGATLFPKAAPEIHAVGGAIAAFDPDTKKWLQGGLNAVMKPSPNLEVDGFIGPKTKAAVEQFQKDHGLVVDGLPGQITQGVLGQVLANLPVLK